jgi:hypothetical protein
MVMRHYGNVEKLEANVSNGHEQGPSEILLHSSPKYAHAHRIITHQLKFGIPSLEATGCTMLSCRTCSMLAETCSA